MIIEQIEKSSLFNFNSIPISSEEITTLPAKEIKDYSPRYDKVTSKAKEETDKKKVSEDEIDDAIRDLEKFSNYFKTHLNFSKDESTGATVIKIVNSETDEIIRQIPSEEILKIASKMQDVIGVLFDREY
jgi:flagellar protein FlaG